jgi:phage repressor protein C with HTH and peptisase S24 domain
MDDESTRKAQGKRLADARKAAGYRSARDAALENNWKESSYRAHETGGRTIGLDDAERYARRFQSQGVQISARQILFGDDEPGFAEDSAPYNVDGTIIPIMGDIGAGDRVEPDYDQPPPDGFDQVELPFPLGDGIIGFRVKGDSMRPKYEAGAIVIVRAEQTRATSQLVGEIAAVRTVDGYRYLKRIMPGPKGHVYNLDSVNGSVLPIVGVRIDWASAVIATIEPRHVKPIVRATKTTGATRSQRGARK